MGLFSITPDKVIKNLESKKVILTIDEKAILKNLDVKGDKDKLKQLYQWSKKEPVKVQQEARKMLELDMQVHFRDVHKLTKEEISLFTKIFIKAKIYTFANPLSTAALKDLKASYELLSKNDVMKSVKTLDDFRNEMKGLRKESLDALERELAELHNTTIPDAYRNPHVKVTHFDKKFLPTGRATQKSPIYYGTNDGEMQKYLDVMKINRAGMTQKQLLDAVFKRGLPARGPNIHLDQHIYSKGKYTSMRGSTQTIGNGEGTSGAAYWADDGGYALVIDGVPFWDVNIVLKGRMKKPDGSFGDPLTKSEQELSFFAQVPPERIQGAYPIFLSKSRNILMKKDFIPNPYYKPEK